MSKKNSDSAKKNSDKIKNLKPFKKGQTGNPNGRPRLTEEDKKERSIQKYLETTNAEFVKSLIESGEYMTYLKQALQNTIAAGKIDGFKFLNDYNGNKPTEKVEHSGDQEKPIIITTNAFG